MIILLLNDKKLFSSFICLLSTTSIMAQILTRAYSTQIDESKYRGEFLQQRLSKGLDELQ